MNVLYHADGDEYPVDDYGQIYIPLETSRLSPRWNRRKKERRQKTETMLC